MAYYGKVEISGVNTANLPVLTGTEAKALFYKMQGRGRSCPPAADRGEFAAGA